MPRIQQESNFAKSVLEAATHDLTTKTHIADCAERLKAVVITPILEKLRAGVVLEPYEEKVIAFIAADNSSDDVQWGASFPDRSTAEILASRELQIAHLSTLSTRLSRDYIMANEDSNVLAGTMKAMTDCTYTYVEVFPPEMHGQQFHFIKNMIFPTPEELAIRVSRAEKGQVPHVAIRYGIGTDVGIDIAPASNVPAGSERSHKAGKALIAATSVYERAVLVASQYDKAVQHLENLRTTSPSDNNVVIEAEKTVATLEKQMQFYRIPLDPQKRPADFKALPAPNPGIQNLARFGGDPNEPLPLIATASGTLARALIALHDLGAFTHENGEFSADTPQYLSTVLCGTLVHGGHHSILEIGEIYNRLLDCQAIDNLEKQAIPSNENEMHYYRIGDPGSLLPEAMRETVLTSYHAKNQADMKSQLGKITNSEEDNDHQPPGMGM